MPTPYARRGDSDPTHSHPHRLAPLARAALGPGRALTGVERLRGGTKKGASTA
ncbi:hypothetical protein GCM10010270_55590 [Streptomyces violaceus]|nr:hypothetical protein GCM10010270_55590 [Streptomyces janthinus]